VSGLWLKDTLTIGNKPCKMIYLASSSPRRAELLTQIGVQFNIIRVDIDESAQDGESAVDQVTRLSREKALKGREQLHAMNTKGLVLAADTLINCQGRVLGKPASAEHCCSMLQQLSGQTHQVLSSIAVINRHGELSEKCSVNEITFRNLKQQEIEQYCSSTEPGDKAGAYAIQGKAAIFIEHISGSYSAVMGLPLFETASLLHQAGYNIQTNNNYE